MCVSFYTRGSYVSAILMCNTYFFRVMILLLNLKVFSKNQENFRIFNNVMDFTTKIKRDRLPPIFLYLFYKLSYWSDRVSSLHINYINFKKKFWYLYMVINHCKKINDTFILQATLNHPQHPKYKSIVCFYLFLDWAVDEFHFFDPYPSWSAKNVMLWYI